MMNAIQCIKVYSRLCRGVQPLKINSWGCVSTPLYSKNISTTTSYDDNSAVNTMSSTQIKNTFEKSVMETYGRFDICLDRGNGAYVYDVNGKEYLDVGGGIAVNALGHAHPEIVKTISDQASKLIHCSNLYYTESQGNLADRLVQHIGVDGKVFFSNSGAEANEGLYKLARAYGQDSKRHKIITAINSFHGRTLGGIAATGQDKIKKGFYPMIDGFKHVPFNDLSAMSDAVDDETAAILIEGIQGEGGVSPATPEYLLGLRKLCDEKNILLMFDSVQCGHFRSGKFQSYQRILENIYNTFAPDAISMAKSLGGGIPIGAFWVNKEHSSLLSPGMHGTTYGGNPLSCSIALSILDVIEEEKLDANARSVGNFFIKEIGENLRTIYPEVIDGIQGMGCMLGIRLKNASDIPRFSRNSAQSSSIQFVSTLHDLGVLTVPAGENIVRLLPPLNLQKNEMIKALNQIEQACKISMI